MSESLLPPGGAAAIARLSAAIAANDAPGVTREAEAAIAGGVPAAAVYEAILQSYLFVGFPRAIEAFFAARALLEHHGGIPAAPEPPSPAEWTARGEALCRRIYGRHYEKLVETMRGFSPDLAAWMILEGYGKTLSRAALAPAERELASVPHDEPFQGGKLRQNLHAAPLLAAGERGV
ncbi:MAG TPA: hypothetical protein VLT84_03955, partial [Acidobacteriota bacterium]|nr:hypothetical protein [Acidobacteriota bacterium]